MRLSEMNRSVKDDMRHIPKGGRASCQQLLRAFYPMQRRHDLKESPLTPRARSLAESIASVRRFRPDFAAQYDHEYFA